MARTVGGKAVLKAPDGTLGYAPPEAVARLKQQGYTDADEAETLEVHGHITQGMPESEQMEQGLLTKPELTGAQAAAAASETMVGSATFGLVGPQDDQAKIRARLFDEQYPLSSAAAQTVPSFAAAVALPGAGALGLGEGLAAQGSAFLGRAALEGSMYAGEQARREGRDFSFTEAAVAGITGEVLGGAVGWTASRAVGGARNLVKGAAGKAASRDAESAVGGTWLKDYQIARDADALNVETARAVTADVNTVLTKFPEVASIARKRDRIAEVISDNPVGQKRFAVDLVQQLRTVKQSLTDTVGEGGGAAKRLFSDLDNTIEEFNSLANNLAQTDGRAIWTQADKLRQAVHEYVQDISQALYDDPARALLSKEGLRTLEDLQGFLVQGTRDANVWGQAAADAQQVYNKAFHDDYFKALKVVNGKLTVVTGKDARGFAVRQAEPGKIARFLKSEMSAEENAAGLSAEFTRGHFDRWLNGIETVALEASAENPALTKEVLTSVNRLRRSAAVGDQIAAAKLRHGTRAAHMDAVGGAALGFAAMGDISGMAMGALMLRKGVSGVRSMHWLGDTLNRLGWFKGKGINIDALLNQGVEIIDKRVAGAQMRQALKRPAGRLLPEGKADEVYAFGKGGPKQLPAWEREVELGADEAKFLGPHTLAPSDYELLDPPPEQVAPFGAARSSPEGGGTERGLGDLLASSDPGTPPTKAGMGAPYVSPAELEELKADLRASGKQGEKIADFLEAHKTELPGMSRPDLAPTAPAPEHIPTQARPDIPDTEARAAARPAARAQIEAFGEQNTFQRAEAAGELGIAPPSNVKEAIARGELPGETTQHARAEAAHQKAGQSSDRLVTHYGHFKAEEFPGLKLPDVQNQFMGKRLHFQGHGVTDADFYQGKDGIIRYVKVQKDPAHAVSEYLANRMLKDFGAKTMDPVLFKLQQGSESYLAYATEKLPNSFVKFADAPLTREAAEDFGRQIPLNVLFGDWDVLRNDGNTFSDGKTVVRLDNGGAGIFHAHGEYRYTHLKNPGIKDEIGQGVAMKQGVFGRAMGDKGPQLSVGPLHPSDLERGAKQFERTGLPEQDWKNLKLAAENPDVAAGTPIGEALSKLGITDRTQLKPLVEEGMRVIQMVKEKWGGWYNYVETRASELPKMYRRDLVKLLETREAWLVKNIPLLSVLPFGALPFINEAESDMTDHEQEGLKSMPPQSWLDNVDYFRKEQQKLLGDAVETVFGRSRAGTKVSNSLSRFKETQPDLRTAFGEKRARMEMLMNSPDELAGRLSEGLRDMPNEAFAASAGGVGRSVQFLQSKLPPRPAEWTRELPVPDHEIRKWGEYYDTTVNPRGALEDLRDRGYLTALQLETLNTLYPDLVFQLQTAIMENLQDRRSMSINGKAMAERILNNTGAVEPAFSRSVSYAAGLAYEQAAQVIQPQAATGQAATKAPAPGGIQAVRRNQPA